MMKRTRTLENRQYRRTTKKTKFSESSFFNILSWDYIRLFLLWISCIIFDMMVGCRLELGYSIVLFVRHYSEMVGAPNGNLKFHSTFSIFYLFMTLMSDLICYLFFPVQKLLFIASTYVWLQVAYQTTDRNLNSTCLGFCLMFFCFEYFIRYQITSLKSRSMLLTPTSLIPTITDAFYANQNSTTRIAFYRVFAAHTLGFPLVTFGCKLKNILSDLFIERKRVDVQKKNELFDKILTEAIPAVYDGRKRHEINSRQHLAIEGDALDFELDPTGSDFLEEPKYYITQGSVPSIFDKISNVSNSIKAGAVDNNGTYNNGSSKKLNKKMSGSLKNTLKATKKVSSTTASSNGITTAGHNDDDLLDEMYNKNDEINYKSTHHKTPKMIKISSWVLSAVQRFFANGLLSIIKIVMSTGSNAIKHIKTISNGMTTDAAAALMADNLRGEDDVTTSLDGSQNYEDEESDRESVMTNTLTIDTLERNGTTSKNNIQCNGWGTSATASGKKKNKKNRGRTPISGYENNSIDGEFELIGNQGLPPLNGNLKYKKGKNGQQHQQQWVSEENEVERLKADLRAAKLIESELREQISGMHSYEKSAKNEVQQFRARYDQLDVKYKQLLKQHEQSKTIMNTLERKISDTQNRRDQLERELHIERSTSVVNKNNENKTNDALVDQLRNKINKLENDLKKIRHEVRNKEDLSIKLETRLKDMQNQRSIAQKSADDGSLTVNRLEIENQQLKKALSEENRVKQDLFLALKTSKAKIDALQSKLKSVGLSLTDETSDTSSIITANGSNTHNIEYRISPTNSSNSPPPSSLSSAMLNNHYYDDISQQYGYSFGSIRSSPSDYDLRDSPTSNLSQLMKLGTTSTTSNQHLTTHSN